MLHMEIISAASSGQRKAKKNHSKSLFSHARVFFSFLLLCFSSLWLARLLKIYFFPSIYIEANKSELEKVFLVCICFPVDVYAPKSGGSACTKVVFHHFPCMWWKCGEDTTWRCAALKIKKEETFSDNKIKFKPCTRMYIHKNSL